MGLQITEHNVTIQTNEEANLLSVKIGETRIILVIVEPQNRMLVW